MSVFDPLQTFGWPCIILDGATPVGIGSISAKDGAIDDHRMARLERLSRLREAGTLTDDEFAAEKAKILDSDYVSPSDDQKAGVGAGGHSWIRTRRAKWIIASAALLVLGVLGGWWWISPYWTLREMQSALAARDAEAFSEFVDFPGLRNDLKADAMADIMEEARAAKDGTDAGFAALGAAMVGPMIDGVISPEGLRVLFAMKNPDGRDFGIMTTAANNVQVVRTSLSEFRIKDGEGGSLVFSLKGLGWKLSGVDPPRKAAAKPTTSGTDLAGDPEPGLLDLPSVAVETHEDAQGSGVSSNWIVGSWSSTGCDGESIQRFDANGRYLDNNYRGRWALEGETLTITPSHMREEGGDIPIQSPRTETYRVERMSAEKASLMLEGGSGYDIIRCS